VTRRRQDTELQTVKRTEIKRKCEKSHKRRSEQNMEENAENISALSF
jgi:hypothetical protein